MGEFCRALGPLSHHVSRSTSRHRSAETCRGIGAVLFIAAMLTGEARQAATQERETSYDDELADRIFDRAVTASSLRAHAGLDNTTLEKTTMGKRNATVAVI